MNEPQAYLNGRWVPASRALVPVTDGGFVQGTTVAEQLRTFGGRLFRLDEHLQRLRHSLAIVEVEPPLAIHELATIAGQLVAHNHALLAPGDDLGLSIFVTPGIYAPMAAGATLSVPGAWEGPTVGMHTFPLRFELWADKYERGQSLATTDVAQVPAACWPSELKCRSRMHYYLADRQAASRHPGSRALMLDDEGFVTETTTANLVALDRDGRLVTPPRHKILPGITLAAFRSLAATLGMQVDEHDLRPADLQSADEVLLTATSYCLLPVVELDGQSIGGGRPGPLFARAMAAWNELVGLNVIEQARAFQTRSAAAPDVASGPRRR
jgi:branched-subunit amino acid aminotransferase/4-amino-4-deoxychorismate lyase